VALISVVAIVIVGTIIGAISGFYGGTTDAILMRITDFMLSLPLIPMYLLTIKMVRTSAQDYVGTVGTIALLFVLFNWMGVSRLVRGAILSLRTYSFVEASRALGANNRRLIFNHLLPNSLAPVLVAATFAAGDFIIWEAVLSYFGQGITDPPAVSLGNLLTDAQDSIWYFTELNPFKEIRAYQILAPAGLIMTTVLCINYIGDALREALDPHRAQSS
jgi:peptide/nickel transport system permease protein